MGGGGVGYIFDVFADRWVFFLGVVIVDLDGDRFWGYFWILEGE